MLYLVIVITRGLLLRALHNMLNIRVIIGERRDVSEVRVLTLCTQTVQMSRHHHQLVYYLNQ